MNEERLAMYRALREWFITAQNLGMLTGLLGLAALIATGSDGTSPLASVLYGGTAVWLLGIVAELVLFGVACLDKKLDPRP